jgi:hypothetical protein
MTFAEIDGLDRDDDPHMLGRNDHRASRAAMAAMRAAGVSGLSGILCGGP